MSALHHVVIVGGGFGGLFAARRLKRSPVKVTLIDRRNFHLFQPLLYQVATGGLSPANIASPLRVLLKHSTNTEVRLAHVIDIDVDNRILNLEGGAELSYDSLILAAGSVPSYFGNHWMRVAPPLKSIADAQDIRRRVLTAFESAELESDPSIQRSMLTFVVIGGGPTGVELTGCISELAHHTLTNDFRAIDPSTARIILIESGERLLASYPPDLSAKAAASLKHLGVEVRLRTRVIEVDSRRVTLRVADRTDCIDARTIVWAAGVQASPIGKIFAERLGVETDKGGRIAVEPDLTVAGHPELFVIGDLAHLHQADGTMLPGVASVAMQQGIYVARLLTRRLCGKWVPAFRYKDRGSIAVIGRNAAVADLGWLHLSGVVAWLLWIFVHLMYLVPFQNRLIVLLQWKLNYLTRNQSALLIPDKSCPCPHD
jgi:NADH dehydrogenase